MIGVDFPYGFSQKVTDAQNGELREIARGGVRDGVRDDDLRKRTAG